MLEYNTSSYNSKARCREWHIEDSITITTTTAQILFCFDVDVVQFLPSLISWKV
jgi:hypothetical protein